MLATQGQRNALLVAAAGLCLVLAAQVLAGYAPVGASGTATGAALGQAGFVYLTGFRSTLAGIMWKRVDEQGDAYYSNVDLGKQDYLLPTARIVTWLDPQYVEPYFVTQWVIARQGNLKGAVDMTLDGLANNPDSGLLRYGYAQLLDDFFGHDPRAYDWALKVVAPDSKWRTVEEKYAGWAIARDLFKRYGDSARYAQANQVLAGLRKPGARLAPSERSVTGR
jgi:hypothetical protein